MKLVETQTLWGNLYRKRHYIDGKRVSEREHTEAFNKAFPTPDAVAKAPFKREELKHTSGVRYIWDIPA